MSRDLSYYLNCFQHMNRAQLHSYSAPHKPILLLCLIDMIEEGWLITNQITLSDDLITRFNNKWHQLVDDGSIVGMQLNDLHISTRRSYPFKCTIDKPFYHLQGEPFWRLEKTINYVARPTYSISSIRKCFEYAEIDAELFELMKDEQSRILLATSLKELI